MEDTVFTVLGIGGSGCRMISAMRRLPGAGRVRLLAVDTDREDLEKCGLPPEQTFLAGEMWRQGLGCGGNVIDGQRAVSKNRREISDMIRGSKMLLIVGGLGGGTATGGTAILLNEASKLHIPAMVMLSLPFSYEGENRRRQALAALNSDISHIADAVIVLPNDLFYASLPATTALESAFQLSSDEMARTALALSELLCSGNLLNADFASFAELLKRKKCLCSLGIGVSRTPDDPDTPEKIFSEMLSSPLLGGVSQLKEADAVIFSLLGGPELSIGAVQNIFGLGERYVRQNAVVLTSAATAPEWSGMLQFSALAIQYDRSSGIAETASLAAAGKPLTPPLNEDKDSLFGNIGVEQPVLPFENVSKGIMESAPRVMWNGEDLDIPTCIRRNVVIDKGRSGRSS